MIFSPGIYTSNMTAYQMGSATDAEAKSYIMGDRGMTLGPWILGSGPPPSLTSSAGSHANVRLRFFFDSVLLGVVFNQMTFWLSWTTNERKLVRVIVVSDGQKCTVWRLS